MRRRLPGIGAARDLYIAFLALLAISTHVVLRYGVGRLGLGSDAPLFLALALGGLPLVLQLAQKALRREFGSDLLAGISIVTAVLLEQYLAGTLVVLMLSGGKAIEALALDRASSVLRALADRMPSVAHRLDDGLVTDIDAADVRVGDMLVIHPHELAPVDGEVLEGHSAMDESYLTGEPYVMSKAPGSMVLSGAINGEAALTIRALRPASGSRHAKIVEVMREAEQNRPTIRRLGDQLGAYYTPLAVSIALAAWYASGDPVRFLAVMVIATPCPLLIAIPVAIIGAISRSAERGIIIRNPAALELVGKVRTMILDKTGTLTYGRPALSEESYARGFDRTSVFPLVAAVERYSKHPLASAVINAAEEYGVRVPAAQRVSEPPGAGLTGTVNGTEVTITGRAHLLREGLVDESELPPSEAGLECVVLIEGRYAATYRFRDAPRRESAPFVAHLRPKHGIDRVLLVSGDREEEVRYFAGLVDVDEVHAGISPEGKVEICRRETERAKTLFLGDGINDAPAMLTATVGVAFGRGDVTSEAASAVIVDTSLARVDELLHIGRRMRRIALQSAIGGMALSVLGMMVAAAGYLPPVAGALAQEAIDLVVVLNALRVAMSPGAVTDF
ncbi:MAG: heavy metal translocating P-type ATPase [Gemmatimonadota bacterium]|nr:heavy metal translocating P-type ATPase [Gemmatimonadota bacterium]